MRGPMVADSTGADKRNPRSDLRDARALMRVAATTHNRYGIFHETGCMVRGAAGSQSPTNERSSEYPPER